MEIGNFTIKPFDDYPDGSKSVWIQDGEEDGGQFPEKDVAATLKEFYDKNL